MLLRSAYYLASIISPKVEAMAGKDDSYPPFDLKRSRFDSSTFLGRLSQILVQFDPRKLLVSDQELDKAISAIDNYKKQGREPHKQGNPSDVELWRAKELVESRCHPDDGKKILLPFCFAAYVPMQPVIILGMLWPGGSVANQVFWQWYNQSYNAMVWYHNKNKSSPLSNFDLFKSYFLACASGIGLSAGIQMWGESMGARRSSMAATVVRSGAPFVGCVGAGWASLISMRFDELRNGVYLFDQEGVQYGKSKIAAREGIAKCCAARVFWNIPALVFSPILLNYYYRTAFHAANPKMLIPVNLLVSTSMVSLGVYPAQAVFTQKAEISAAKLEPEFRTLGIEKFYFNKGL
eukprot:jgi/Bigna1/127945/aug1.5_g2653